ncbi:hypothetical protein FJR38_12360 [Anabaena sp. UHCC 0253]|uniref:hypothetical protein n=1 Tax=Anabaena sp. UHCC 0253 TaxID=2590019 RepID=UPI00144777F8|nr:hypothetical protein [Anabaena sp. UHCC 0253]MTJ53377.1 hypothetical protein [Anabaena sp. UHCC 0253]
MLSMLTPASAFVKACKMIIDVVKFFMERAQQIADLINAIIDSVTAASLSVDIASSNRKSNSSHRKCPGISLIN